MAKDVEVQTNKFNVWQILGLIAAVLVLGALVGYALAPNVEVVKVPQIKEVLQPVNTSEYIPITEYVKLNATYNELDAEYKDDQREKAVKGLAEVAIEDNFIEELDFDEDEFDDSTFVLAFAKTYLDEDEGDYEAITYFIILEYNDEEELLTQYLAVASMEIQDDDDVKKLEIEFAPEPIEPDE